MKAIKMKYVLKGLLFLLITGHIVTSCRPGSVSQKAERFRLKNGDYIDPYAAMDFKSFRKYYRKNPDRWDKAFAFLKTQDLDQLPVGEYDLEGKDLFVKIQEYTTKQLENTKYETHKIYADIQYLVRGKEKIGIRPEEPLSEIMAYDPERDVAFFKGTKGTFYTADSSTFFIFFPRDAHRPCIAPAKEAYVKKLVIKVKLD